MKTAFHLLSSITLLATMLPGHAVTVSPDEMAEAGQWVTTRFENRAVAMPAEAALVILANHDQLQRNGRHGRPLRLTDGEHTRGLFCHAPSSVLVRLPGPGGSFRAVVGVDQNDNTARGCGSVVFSVQVGAVEKFRSEVMVPSHAARTAEVDLGGATEFLLQIEPTSDGIACDQADWAEARVTLLDGREVWLADLPIHDRRSRRLFAAAPPFSFVYGGRPSAEFLGTWVARRESRPLDARRTEHVMAWSDPVTLLELRVVALAYHDFPVVEWTLHFRNVGATNTPLIERIQALDIQMDRGDTAEFLLHHAVGSPADGNDYGPLESVLRPGSTKRLGGAGGRPTHADWSYFNLEWPLGEGLIAAVGWPGQWAAEFKRDEGRGLGLSAGQELTRFTLQPGESVRSPLVALLFYKGEWLRAQNLWRRWMMAHSMPRPGGELPRPQLLASSSRQYDEMIKANETNQILFIDRYLAEGLKLDYWWMDAGWYVHHGGGWPRVGTWLVDSNRFPRGLRAVSDHAHQRGLKTLVWFEPERVTPGTWLAQNHPEWILGGTNGGLLNLGVNAAREWLTDHVDRLITDQGIDLYRQDFNMDPLSLWRGADAPDRQGLTEIRHVTGYLAYWDELRRRHPQMLIDSCASGGRRNDLETMRRAVPLWRSDYAYEAVGHQCMTYGISLWLPFHGTGTVATRNAPYYGSGPTPVEPYAFWSNAGPSVGCGFDMRERLDYALLRRLIDQWRQIGANYYGDFWPLTGWSRDTTLWMAWQFDRPEAGQGIVQVFRRQNSPYESARFRLRAVERDGRYTVLNLDEPTAPKQYSGRDLLEQGLPIAILEQPGVAVLSYQKL